MKPAKASLLATLLFVSVHTLHAQTVTDLFGHWEGSVQVPNTSLSFEVDLVKSANGELSGTFSNPAEHLKGLPLSNFALEGKSLRFQIKGSPGERAFKGTLSPDGKSMSGVYNEGGYSMPFEMARTGDARIEATSKSAPIGKELEGAWNGMLDVEGKQLRLVLTMSNGPDGSTGNVVSLDEGLEIPIAAIMQKGRSLTLDFKAVGGSFSGELKADSMELAGTYTQGSLVAPLTFRRAAATNLSK